LKFDSGLSKVQLRYEQASITVVSSGRDSESLADSDSVESMAAVDLEKHGRLDIIVEKDFACLDLSDADNKDTFPNPQIARLVEDQSSVLHPVWR